ncbi:hypothetical protein [Castellaniella defragrans]|uniref:Uncharacterized protein n=2 Tax=Castellaniella defragrans TaxID=75697 RepID=A0A7W9TQK7_CASDE|nr:hypothetical protein [Castellaniella defragrans]MBB6084884.1 hypothetical protein [Castellaniella defragrans]
MTAHISVSDWKLAGFSGAFVATTAWLEWRHLESMPMTHDSISMPVESAMGLAVVAAVVIALILSLSRFLTHFRRYRGWTAATPGAALRAGLRLGGRNALAALCVLVSAGVFWQRWAGSTELSPELAALVVAAVGGLAALAAAASARRAHERFIQRAVPHRPPMPA